jgi:DNA ligase-1
MVGALRVRTPEGVSFSLGSGLSDAQRREPPAVGAWVTYRFRDVTDNGVPRFATFVRERAPE